MIDVPDAPGLPSFLGAIRWVLLNASMWTAVLFVMTLALRRGLRGKPSQRHVERLPLILLGASVVFFAVALMLTIGGSAFD